MSPSMYDEQSAANHSPERCIVMGGCAECRDPGRTVSVLLEDYFPTGLEDTFTPTRNKVSNKDPGRTVSVLLEDYFPAGLEQSETGPDQSPTCSSTAQ